MGNFKEEMELETLSVVGSFASKNIGFEILMVPIILNVIFQYQ